MDATNILEVHGISFGYNDDRLLQNISCSVAAGELVALIGPNGSGKTTLLKIMLGLLKPRSGVVVLLGQPLETYASMTRAKAIAYVSQQPALGFPLTVRELVALGRYPHGTRGRETKADTLAINSALERTAATDLRTRPFNSLSGGEKQKILIARALAQSAQVLLLDEPTLHLDVNFQLQILSALKRLCIENGTSVVTVLHDVNLVSLFADKALLLSGGTLCGFGPVAEVINEASIKKLLGVDMKQISGNDGQPRYFVPRHPFS